MLPFFAAIVPLVWWKFPFTGSRKRRFVLCLAVSIVALMAIVKELDLHNMALHALCPDYVGEDGKLIPFVKGVFSLDPVAWSVGCFGGSGVLVHVADRLPSWLGHAHGLEKSAAGVTAAQSLCTALEEGGEMMIAIFALLAIFQSQYIHNRGENV